MPNGETSRSQNENVKISEQPTALGHASNRPDGKVRDFDAHARQLAEKRIKGKAKQEYQSKNSRAIDEYGKPVEKTVNLTSEYRPGFRGALAGMPGLTLERQRLQNIRNLVENVKVTLFIGGRRDPNTLDDTDIRRQMYNNKMTNHEFNIAINHLDTLSPSRYVRAAVIGELRRMYKQQT